MNKILLIFTLAAVMMMAGCSKEDVSGGTFIPPTHEQLMQTAYADNENTDGGGFSFTTDAPWMATVNEIEPQVAGPASIQDKPVARTADDNANNVIWLRLYNGNSEAYSGGAGTITLRIEIDQNYTGERREAMITIRSGNNNFTVTVVQEGTKHDGSQNEPPVKVTNIALDKTELILEAGDRATLTATVTPADATIKSVIWSSGNPSIATVNAVTGEITAIADGSTTVTATSSSNKGVSASCTVTVGGNEPTIPPSQKLIARMENTYWYYSGAGNKEEDGNDIVNFFYDGKSRLTKMVVETYSETTDPSPGFGRRRIQAAAATPSTTARALVPVTITVVFTYGDKSVAYEITRKGEGAADSYRENGSAKLDDAGRVVSGKFLSYDDKGNNQLTQWTGNYELFYDAEGRLVKSISTDSDEERITWTGGNPTEVWWGTVDSYDLIDKASYGTVPNKTNLDLNWYVELEPEGWAFASGDSNNLFPLIGLTGKRSEHMAETVYSLGVPGSGSTYKYECRYQTDADGLLTKITRKYQKSSAEAYEVAEMAITYTE